MRIWRRNRFEEDMDAEVRFHIEAYIADLVRSGIDRGEAERRAHAEFGSIAAKKDECREAWGLQRLDELRADLRLTLRMIGRNPAFAAIAILSLALGIGANAALFGVLDAVMLRLLPIHEPSRLVFVDIAGTVGRDGPPYPCFELIRDQARSFEAVAAFSQSAMELTSERGRELARGVWVSGNFYETLGVTPLIGRSLTAADDRIPGKGGPDGAVAVISRAYWQEKFGGDPAVVGRTVRVFNFPVTIVGVMPTATMTLEPGVPVDIAVPMMLSDAAKLRDRAALWLYVAARLKPGVSMEQARAESEALFQAYMATDVPVSSEIRKRLYDRMEIRSAAKGLSGLRSQFSKPLTVLSILAGLVLLAACVNTCSLMLARATARQREFAVRLAIGAGRGRLIRQTLTEALVLAGAGAALGVLLAQEGQLALAAFFAEGTNRIVLDLSLNGRVLLFTLTVSVLCAVALGILPALRAARLDPATGLQSGSRSIAGNRVSLQAGRALIVVQVALSLVLLGSAGLFIRSLRQLESVDLGFPREGILTMEITPEQHLFGTAEWLSLQSEIVDRIHRIPGVRSAGWASATPLSGRGRGAVLDVPGFTPRSDRDREVHLAAISPEYFDTLGVPLLVGRGFTTRDSRSHKVAIFNETAVRHYFGNTNPIGHQVRFTNYPSRDLVYEIVGVVKDFKHNSLREPSSRFIYLPIPQSVDRINRLALAIRGSANPLAFAAAVRQQIQGTRSTLLINHVSTIEKQTQQALIWERLVAALSTTFGMVALTLACLGLYGILAYSVTRRTHEIGVRLALGATRSGIVLLVMKEALVLAGCGIVIGVPAVLWLGRVTKALLYGVEPSDLGVFASAAVLLLGFAVVAAIVPSRRASLLDPMSALRRD